MDGKLRKGAKEQSPAHERQGSIQGRVVRGSCLCGTVVFEVDGDAAPIELCHCPRCRKAYGGAFAATLYVRASALRWLQGEDSLVIYDAPIRQRPPAYRHVFCRACGSALPIVNRELDFAEIPAGVLDDDPGTRPLRHIFTARKAQWFDITDNLPRHAEHAPPAERLLARLAKAAK